MRRSRPLSYRLDVTARRTATGMVLAFAADERGAVFHVYDRKALGDVPRRYTVAAGDRLEGRWDFDSQGAYDLWILGPGGFHRHFVGHHDGAPLDLSWTITPSDLVLHVPATPAAAELTITRLLPGGASASHPLTPGDHR